MSRRKLSEPTGSIFGISYAKNGDTLKILDVDMTRHPHAKEVCDALYSICQNPETPCPNAKETLARFAKTSKFRIVSGPEENQYTLKTAEHPRLATINIPPKNGKTSTPCDD